jgi:type IV pilus assembly protein PilB
MAALDNKSLYDYLLRLKVIEPDVLQQKFNEAGENNTQLQDVLISSDLISNDDLGQILAEISGFPVAKLSGMVIADDVLNLIPKEVAQRYKVIIFARQDREASLAMQDPSNANFISALSKSIDLKIKPFIATNKDLEDAIDKYSKDVSKTFQNIVRGLVEEGKTLADLPIEKVQDVLLNYAYDNKASDVHIEPTKDGATVRVRIDGVLHDIVTLPKTLYEQFVNRVKFLSKLRIDEHSAAQDGKMIFKTKEDLDIRVSILPSTLGEVISMRLLSERSRQFDLPDLGLASENLNKITNAYKKPFGMILSVGPTGSGKTTTLYAIVKLLNKREVKIMTIEDPVEYEIPGVDQIQVNPKTNLTFAEGLKSIARQDPDIILVGEIRDEETAGIAVNSALTGHLVLSTLHANDAATAFPRMLDFKVEPFLISSTLNLVIAQRLVRKVCTSCRVSQTMETNLLKDKFSGDELLQVFGNTQTVDVFKGKGCPVCFGTGYLGRIGVFEVMEVSDAIRKAINQKEDAETIRQIAVSEGMKTMNQDALQKVKEGITTIEEVIRTTKE